MQQYTAEAAALADKVGSQVVDQYAGMALLSFAEDADVPALAEGLGRGRGVAYAEPNYVYTLPPPIPGPDGDRVQTQYVVRRAPKGLETGGKKQVVISIQALRAMRTVKGTRVLATYPNDRYLWWNNGWDWVGASIVWPNTTPSAGVCVLDTGVDYTHKDLSLSTIKGYDFVNGDADPMDDYGHGTHVAGIIAAKMNNAEGIAGVSTGKVVAVKVMGSQGWGTSFDIAKGINYCANRLDVRVLNLSLGGGLSNAAYAALDYAVNTKGKLVVAAAGNNASEDPIYPAGYADPSVYPEFENKVLAVAASGLYYEDPPDSDEWYVDNYCKADYSNYGEWVSVVAPGTSIYSTTPWDKPFYLNQYYGVQTRYSWMDGTSMAAPFVAAAAARRWGYKPLETNDEIGWDVINYGWEVDTDYDCWPASMAGKTHVDVANLMDRGAITANAFDASAGTALVGAQVQMYQGTTLKGSGVVTPYVNGPWPWEQDPTRVYMWFDYSDADVLNLPAGSGYVPKINKTGYTASPQLAYRHGWNVGFWLCGGCWYWLGEAGVPPKSTNIDAVLGWWWWWRDDAGIINNPGDSDLDLDVWLPNVPNPLDAGQPAPFIVGVQGDAFGYLEGNSLGAMTAFPFARFKREGGYYDWLRIEDTTISSRKAHAPLLANPALPYYPGEYTLMVTDFGQTIDHDDDGDTPEIPLMGVYFQPYIYIWKDGVVKRYVRMGLQDPYDPCNAEWWNAATISSGVSGTPTYTIVNACGDGSIVPYYAAPFKGFSK